MPQTQNKKKKGSHRKLYTVGPNAPFQFVEAYKSLRTNLEFLSATANYRTILVTSSVPEEGKSNVALNLALTLSSAGKRVVLVDGDLRKGTLTRYLHVARKHAGITNYLAGSIEWEQVLISIENQNLLFLPTGPLPPNPVELLASPKMSKAFEELKGFTDYIIVDTPPVSVVTDAAVMCRLGDGVVLVVRPGVTTIEGSQLSKRNLEAVNAKIMGVVVNGYDAKKSSHRDGYYYSYSYDYYSSDDGSSKAGTKE